MPRIFDGVYGYIELNDVEFKLVNSPIFQRLHWIKQLGPLHTVFPSAQHSRFSHTLGVFYIVTKMISHLEKRFKTDEDKHGYKFKGKDKEILRFAALLHDIGHVPLSHTGEEVLKEDAKDKLVGKVGDRVKDDKVEIEELSWWSLFEEQEYKGTFTKLHERLSAEIVLHNKEIDKILTEVKGWKTPGPRRKAKERIAQIIVGRNLMDIPTLLLHSELDADRLDYLLRDSFFTGVGYGRIELDYIISRLAIFKDIEGVDNLCVEAKGLHTIEHYILGRFFLRTQVIFNRIVRCMDLLFSDVMRYMVSDSCHKDCIIMDLAEFCDRIKKCKGKKKREHLHKIYAYTDAQVFAKMRSLHEKLDSKENNNTANPEELYINDCIKIIMDGEVPKPVYNCQRRIDLKKKEGFKDELQDEANKIAQDTAKKIGVYSKRIKANLIAPEVMRFKKRFGEDERANMEAVKIMYKKPGGEEIVKYAAESNATILEGLTDRAIVIFNVYYVPSRRTESKEAIEGKKRTIEEAYSDFVSRHFQDQ